MFPRILPLLFVLTGCSLNKTELAEPVALLNKLNALEKRLVLVETELALRHATPQDSMATPPCGPGNPYCCDEKMDDCD